MGSRVAGHERDEAARHELKATLNSLSRGQNIQIKVT